MADKGNALWNKKAKLWVAGRKDWETKLTKAFRPLKNQPLAWFHCASLGEFEQGRPLIEAFKKAFPAHKILLTFFSPSGFEVRKNYSKADFVCYLPADTRYNAKIIY